MRIDYHFGHYLKAILDEVFDKNNFSNEIVIKRGYVTKSKANRFLTETDSLFFYTKTDHPIFHGVFKKRKEEERVWRSLEMPGERKTYEKQIRYFNGKPKLPPKGQHWGLSQEMVDRLIEKKELRINNGREYINLNGKKEKGMPEFLIGPYKRLGSNWTDIESYSIPSKWGYPTENSESLLERVVACSSNEGDIVLDCFAGSGTTGVVAEKLKRKWIMVDSSKLAIYTMQKRLLNLREEISNKGRILKPKPFVLYNAGLYQDSGFLEKMEEADYRKFVLELFNAEPNDHKIKGVQMH